MSDDFDPAQPGSYGFWLDETVRYADIDRLGHVNNNAFGVYFEDVRVNFFSNLNIFRPEAEQAVVVARTVNEFRRELHHPSRIRIGLRVARVGNSSVTLFSGVFRDDILIATQEAVCVIVDSAAHRPVKVSDESREALLRLGRPSA